MIDLIQAILALDPNAKVAVNNIDAITWYDGNPKNITKITLTNIIVNSKHTIEKKGFKEKHPLTKELLMPRKVMPRKVKKIIINA